MTSCRVRYPFAELQFALADGYVNRSLVVACAAAFWERAQGCGLKLWGASAFKGASEPDAVWVPLGEHAGNHVSWMERARLTPLQARDW